MKKKFIFGTGVIVIFLLTLATSGSADEAAEIREKAKLEMRQKLEAQGMTRDQIDAVLQRMDQYSAEAQAGSGCRQQKGVAAAVQSTPRMSAEIGTVSTRKTVLESASGQKAEEPAIGTAVLVYDGEDGLWYPARIAAIESGRFKVTYYDRENPDEYLARGEFKTLELSPGTPVKIYGDNDELIDATVIEGSGSTWIVEAGGSRRTVPLAEIVVP